VSRFWQAFTELLGVTTAMSSAYHPQTDGGFVAFYACLLLLSVVVVVRACSRYCPCSSVSKGCARAAQQQHSQYWSSSWSSSWSSMFTFSAVFWVVQSLCPMAAGLVQQEQQQQQQQLEL
jgi:hypothetical protein